MNKKVKSPLPTMYFIIAGLIGLIIIILVSAGCGRKESVEPETLTPSAYVVPTEPETEEKAEPETKEKAKEKKIKLKSNEEIAQEVIDGKWGNGKARYKALTKAGYDADAIQSIVDKTFIVKEVEYDTYASGYSTIDSWSDWSSDNSVYYTENTGSLNPYVGVVYYDGHKETYYSQNVLPGDGLNIPGRHVADDGTVRDADGYICVAADPSYMPYGSVVETSLGTAKVYDSGCDYGTIDIYTDW